MRILANGLLAWFEWMVYYHYTLWGAKWPDQLEESLLRKKCRRQLCYRSLTQHWENQLTPFRTTPLTWKSSIRDDCLLWIDSCPGSVKMEKGDTEAK